MSFPHPMDDQTGFELAEDGEYPLASARLSSDPATKTVGLDAKPVEENEAVRVGR